MPYLLDRWLDEAEEYAINVQGIPEHLEGALREAVSCACSNCWARSRASDPPSARP